MKGLNSIILQWRVICFIENKKIMIERQGEVIDEIFVSCEMTPCHIHPYNHEKRLHSPLLNFSVQAEVGRNSKCEVAHLVQCNPVFSE